MKKKFTLVELLVVVVIIAILAAILLPSLLRAKYQARLISCVNNLSQNGKAMMIYTMDHDSQYPNLIIETDRWAVSVGTRDARPFFGSIYGDLDDMLACPLNEQPSIVNSTARHIFTSYDVYGGTTLTITGTEMFDINDVPEVDGHDINVIMGDALRFNGKKILTPHPGQNLQHGMSDGPDWGIGAYGSRRTVPWSNLDKNFVYNDGHVSTVRDISGDSSGIDDDRLVDIDNQNRPASNSTHRSFVPTGQ